MTSQHLDMNICFNGAVMADTQRLPSKLMPSPLHTRWTVFSISTTATKKETNFSKSGEPRISALSLAIRSRKLILPYPMSENCLSNWVCCKSKTDRASGRSTTPRSPRVRSQNAVPSPHATPDGKPGPLRIPTRTTPAPVPESLVTRRRKRPPKMNAKTRRRSGQQRATEAGHAT